MLQKTMAVSKTMRQKYKNSVNKLCFMYKKSKKGAFL